MTSGEASFYLAMIGLALASVSVALKFEGARVASLCAATSAFVFFLPALYRLWAAALAV